MSDTIARTLPAAVAASLLAATVFPAAQPAPSRPLRLEPGLVVVTAVNDKVLNKDYEAVLTVGPIDADGVQGDTVWAIPDRQAPEGVRKMSAHALERAQDIEHARRLILWHLPGDPETLPGTTGPTPSTDVFADLQRSGETAVVVGAVSTSDTMGLGALGGLFAGRKYFRGTIKKLGTETVRVLVDGVPTPLSAVHAGGTVTVADDRGDVHFWWLDDPGARFALTFGFQGSLAQVVKIDRPKSGDGLGQALAGPSCRSEVPGIYFLTDSSELLPSSTPAVRRIADLLKAHPDWSVTIEGHTDNTGTDQHNLDLSKRRAESLKTELASKYAIPASRMQTAGFGRTKPVDTNDTLDGRAHNRRVEIARRC